MERAVAVRGLRGATTVDADTPEQISTRIKELLLVMLGDVPLLCAREVDVVGATPLCLRVLMHLTTTQSRDELHHVYLHGARGLRDDLPE
jgi:chorismate mutase